MRLLIHDLNDEEWKEIAGEYEGWKIISDNGTIKPCVGCFGCWVKEPGQCVIKDGYEKMGALIHASDEVTVISRYTYGGFGSFVKNVFDRSIGWVLPYFEVYRDEMHHKKRYPEDKPFTFIFRGSTFTDKDKKKAEAYVDAVCTNLRGSIKSIRFEETGEQGENHGIRKEYPVADPGKIILLNCSLRGNNANSKKFLDRIAANLDGNTECINLSSYIGKYDELADVLGTAGTIVFGMPLYVDGIPSAALHVMELLETCSFAEKKNIYAVTNMGLYESRQLKNMMSMIKMWCDKCGFIYGGGVAIGAGEMMSSVMSATAKGPAKFVTEGLDKLTDAINTASAIDDIYADAYCFPRFLYMLAANSGWPRAGKLNGLKKKDLLRFSDLEVTN